jgi:PAS domain S-box-containing protein
VSGDAAIDLRRVIEDAHEAFVVMDDDGTVRDWNHAAEELFGWRADEVIGSRLSERIIPERYRELHERGLRRYLDTGVGPVLGTTIEIEGVDRDGIEVPVELTIHSTEDATGSRCFYAFLRDIGERRRSERASRAAEDVAWACAGAPDGMLDPNELAGTIGRALEASLAIVWLPSPNGEVIVPAGTWAAHDAGRVFILESVGTALGRGQGLPGRAWDTGEPAWSADVADDPRFVRAQSARVLGLRSGIFIPIGSGGSCQGVVEVLTTELRRATDGFLRSLGALGVRLAAHVPANVG